MLRHFNWDGTEYFGVEFGEKRHYREVCELTNQFIWTGGVNDKITVGDVDEYLSDNHSDNEIWLLGRYQKRLLPIKPFHDVKKVIAQQGALPPRFYRGLQQEIVYDAVIWLSPTLVRKESYLILCCDLFARDPFSQVGACAYWMDLRLRTMSDGLGGANEFKLVVAESDLPLQKELKSLGYFAFEQERKTGNLFFSKILKLAKNRR